MVDERWPNVQFDEEFFDCGTRYGLTFSILDESGEPILRHAATTSSQEQLTPAIFAPDEKVYVTSLEEVPVAEPEESEDGSGTSEGRLLAPLYADGAGPYYIRKGCLLTPATYRSRSREEMRQEMGVRLKKYLALLARAAQRLAV